MRWHDRRNGSSSGSALRLVRTSGARSREISGTVQAANPGNHATSQGRQHQGDNGRVGPYMRGWRGYFGFCETPEVLIALKKPGASGKHHVVCERHWSLGVLGELRNAAGSCRGPWHLARSKALSVRIPTPTSNRSVSHPCRRALAQLLESPYTDPYVRWCGRGGAERLPPIPILGTNAKCRDAACMSEA